MKIKAYRWTRLTSALSLIKWTQAKHTTYWVTDKEESRPYAEVEKWEDKNEEWAIIEATLDFPHSQVYYISPSEWKWFNLREKKILLGRTGIFETEKFKVIILSKERQSSVTEPKLIEIV